jgi:uncharacterized protein
VRPQGIDVRPPGVYTEPSERRREALALGPSGVPGFVGLARRGPTRVPVRIASPKQFTDIFGELPEGGFLQPTIEAFFRNGGQECWVVRVTHRTGGAYGEPSSRATRTFPDRRGRPAFLVEAGSEGSWGNDVTVSFHRRPPRAQTFLTLDADVGDTSAVLRSTHGLRPGALVRLYREGFETFRVLTAVEGKTVSWKVDQPLETGLISSAPSYVETVEFDLKIASPFLRESFLELSLHPASPGFVERVVADRSRLVRVTLLDPAEGVGRLPTDLDLPAESTDVALEGGLDGLWNVTPDDLIGMTGGPGERTGLAALEIVEDVDLLAVPDALWLFRQNAGRDGRSFSTLKDVEVVHDAMLGQCERLKDRFALLDTPFPESADRTREYRLMFDSRQGALYFPWVILDRHGQRLAIPPSGHLAGIMARCDGAVGIHKAPANEVLSDADDLTVLLVDEDVGLLNDEGINCLVSQGVRGLRVWGARTISSDTTFRYLNVRRQLNAVQKTLSNGMQWVVFEPNVPSLWKTVERNVTQFLMDLWRRGWFQGESPEDGFYVKCDDETNPREERDAGRLIVEVGVAPVRPAEFLTVHVAQEMQNIPEGG